MRFQRKDIIRSNTLYKRSSGNKLSYCYFWVNEKDQVKRAYLDTTKVIKMNVHILFYFELS